MSAALDRLTASVANLTAAVDAKLSEPAPVATEAELNTISDQIDAATAKLTAPPA